MAVSEGFSPQRKLLTNKGFNKRILLATFAGSVLLPFVPAQMGGGGCGCSFGWRGGRAVGRGGYSTSRCGVVYHCHEVRAHFMPGSGIPQHTLKWGCPPPAPPPGHTNCRTVSGIQWHTIHLPGVWRGAGVGIEPGTSRTRRDVLPTRPWRRGCSVGGGDGTPPPPATPGARRHGARKRQKKRLNKRKTRHLPPETAPGTRACLGPPPARPRQAQ